MPNSTNVPDKYFLSNFNIEVLRNLQNLIVKEHLAINPIQNGIFNKDTLIRYAKIKTMFAVLKSESVFQMDMLNDKIKLLQDTMANEFAVEVKNTGTNSMQTHQDLLKEITSLYSQYINDQFLDKGYEVGSHSEVENTYTFPKANVSKEIPIFQSKGFPTIETGQQDYTDEVNEYIESGLTQPFKVLDRNGAVVNFTTSDGVPIHTGWVIKTKNGTYTPDPLKTFTKNKPASEVTKPLIDAFYKNKLTPPPGAIKFFIEKLHGAYSDFKPYKKNGIKSTESRGFNDNLSNRAVFAAFLDKFDDSYSQSTSNINFLGASEGFSVYGNTSRSMTLSFSIISDYSLEMLLALKEIYKALQVDSDIDTKIQKVRELSYYDKGLGFLGMPNKPGDVGAQIVYSDTPETLWKKITFLAQCCYPYYRVDGKLKEMPYIRLRLGDFYDVNGVIKSLSIDSSEFDNGLDLNPSNIGVVPFAVKITMSLDVYHDWEPNSEFYGFYNRKEFDNNTADKITGKGLFTNVTKFGDPNSRMEDLADKSATGNNSSTDAKGSVPSKEMLGTTKGNSTLGSNTTFKTGIDSVPGANDLGLGTLGNDINSTLNSFTSEFESYKTKIANGLIDDKQVEAKKQLGLVDRINSLTDELKNIYGYTSQPLSNIGNLKDNFKDSIEGYNQLKNSAEKAFGGINSNLAALNEKIRKGEQGLKKVGIDLKMSKDVNETLNKINELRLKNLIPKTLDSIIKK